MTHEIDRESAVLLDWCDYLNASIKALQTFEQSIQWMMVNANREHKPGDFDASLRQLVDVIGAGYTGDAMQDLDALHAIVTGEGLPIVPVYANAATREAARLDAVFGPGSTLALEVRFMPVGKVEWLDLTPILLIVRQDHMRDDVTLYYLEQVWARDNGPCASEIRVNVPGSSGALAYWNVSK